MGDWEKSTESDTNQNVYYIPFLEDIKDDLSKNCKSLIVPQTTNLIKISSNEEKQLFINNIKQLIYLKDKELSDYFKKNMPEVSNFLRVVPIKNDELREMLRHIFYDIPEDSFKGSTVLQSLTSTFNYVIRKNEIEFLIQNLANDELLYDVAYKYKSQANFYYNLMKFKFNLDSYWLFFSNTQAALRRLFLKQILFSEGRITGKEQQLLNRVFNLNGSAMSDFDYQLEVLKNQIHANKLTLKRTRIPVSPKYRKYEQECLERIIEVQKEVKKIIKTNQEDKKNLEIEIKKRHGLISRETAKKLLSGIPHIGNLFKD